MNTLFYTIIFILSFSKSWSDPILPSYERDEGDWPIGVVKSMDSVIDRWFIDIHDAKCKPLEYRGIKGNYNNFASKGLCEMHGKLTVREKLKGCKKPMHPGHCVKNTGTTPKYYFDQTTARCKQFLYNGCGGSFNRYESDTECYLYCLNKKNGGLTNADDTNIDTLDNKNNYLLPNSLDCDIKPDVKDKDPGTAIIADTNNNKCAFAAVSIDSNTRGIFRTFSECVKKSHKHDTNAAGIDTKKMRIPACDNKPHQYAVNNEQQVIFRYYHDADAKICKRMETGQPTESEPDFIKEKNNFPTMEMCHSYCGAEKYKKEIKIEETCTQPMKGKWKEGESFNVKRYYYISNQNKCKAFNYNGYDGNSNNFKSGEQCQKICGGHYNEGNTIVIDEVPES